MMHGDKTIWIDLDNTPHVPFFRPIIAELEKRGFHVLVTARDAFQVCELAERSGIRFTKVGRHHGKNRVRKLLGLFYRAFQLAPSAMKRKPLLAVSHGSRAQIILSNMLGIPSLLLTDYEFAKVLPLMRPVWEMVPEVIPSSTLACPPDRVLTYPGIKEDVYVPSFTPSNGLLQELGVDPGEIIITARPPANEAHYHREESDVLFNAFMDRASASPGIRVILLPRNTRQGEMLLAKFPHWFENRKTIIPARAVDGLNLLWHSDLVVSGGGTMNREAAALGVPVYSVFRGSIGAVDRFLAETGRLTLVSSTAEVDSKIQFQKRAKNSSAASGDSSALLAIVNAVEKIVVKDSRVPVAA